MLNSLNFNVLIKSSLFVHKMLFLSFNPLPSVRWMIIVL